MAKATVTCTCKECGATFTKETTKQNRREADAWEAWAVNNYDQCPSCWGKAEREAEKARGLVLEITMLPFSYDCPIQLAFVGDTYSYKDEIKALGGYSFGQIEAPGLFGVLSTHRPPKGWSQLCKIDGMDAEIAKAAAIGAKIENKVTEMDLLAHAQALKSRETKAKEVAEKKEADKAALDNAIAAIVKPTKPACYPTGKWNGKIYGSKTKSIYVDGDKVDITASEVKEIEAYQAAREVYNQQIKTIKEAK